MDEVRSQGGFGAAASPAAAGVHALQLAGAHQASDPLAATAPPEPGQLGKDSRSGHLRAEKRR